MGPPRGTKRLSFLVVDDIAMDRSLLSGMLSRFGRVDTADSGARALEVFEETSDGGGRYDLVLLDIVMPGMDGIAVLKKLRDFEQQKSLPETLAVMTSGLDKSSSVRGAIEAGAVGYLIKPLSFEKVTGEMRRLGVIER